MRCICKRRNVLDAAEEIWRLDHERGGLIVNGRGQCRSTLSCLLIEVREFEMNTRVLYVSLYDFEILRMDCCGSDRFRSSGNAFGHQDSFSQCRRTVVHRRISQVHARQLANKCLKLEDRLQRALR